MASIQSIEPKARLNQITEGGFVVASQGWQGPKTEEVTEESLCAGFEGRMNLAALVDVLGLTREEVAEFRARWEAAKATPPTASLAHSLTPPSDYILQDRPNFPGHIMVFESFGTRRHIGDIYLSQGFWQIDSKALRVGDSFLMATEALAKLIYMWERDLHRARQHREAVLAAM